MSSTVEQAVDYRYPFKHASQELISQVWHKSRAITPNGTVWNSASWRWDKCGMVMKFSEHGNISSDFGWEIDHIKPVALGGSDDIPNLQPLFWKNNRAKGDVYPWGCE